MVLGRDQQYFLHPQPALLQHARPHSSAAPGPDHAGAERVYPKEYGGRTEQRKGLGRNDRQLLL